MVCKEPRLCICAHVGQIFERLFKVGHTTHAVGNVLQHSPDTPAIFLAFGNDVVAQHALERHAFQRFVLALFALRARLGQDGIKESRKKSAFFGLGHIGDTQIVLGLVGQRLFNILSRLGAYLLSFLLGLGFFFLCGLAAFVHICTLKLHVFAIVSDKLVPHARGHFRARLNRAHTRLSDYVGNCFTSRCCFGFGRSYLTFWFRSEHILKRFARRNFGGFFLWFRAKQTFLHALAFTG